MDLETIVRHSHEGICKRGKGTFHGSSGCTAPVKVGLFGHFSATLCALRVFSLSYQHALHIILEHVCTVARDCS